MTNRRLVSHMITLCVLTLCAVACSAEDYAVVPVTPFIAVGEASKGAVVDFQIINFTDFPLLVVGEGPKLMFQAGDIFDNFAADPFGHVVPFSIPPGATIQHVFIAVPGEVDDPTDKLGGVWSLNLNPDVCFDPFCVTQAQGLDNGMIVQITDAPEPNSILLFGSAIAGLSGILRRKLRLS
jgi:hypothetical protein